MVDILISMREPMVLERCMDILLQSSQRLGLQTHDKDVVATLQEYCSS
jgi:hypothetical protein